MLYYITRFIACLVFTVIYPLKVEGREHIPAKGPFMICSNHISWFDPPAIGSAFPAKLKVHFMAKRELFSNRALAYFFRKIGAFPVNRKSADYGAIRKALQIASEGGNLGLFPEGTRSKTGELMKAEHGAAMIAGRSNIPIVPVAVIGPYRIGRFVKIVIGAPFELPKLEYERKAEKKEKLEKMSEEIMQKIKNLFPSGDNLS